MRKDVKKKNTLMGGVIRVKMARKWRTHQDSNLKPTA